MTHDALISYLDAQKEPHLLFDTSYRIMAVNDAFRKSCPHEGDIIGRTCYAVSHHYDAPCDRSGETCPLARSTRSGRPERVLHMHYTPAGKEYVSIEITPIRNGRGKIECFVEKIEQLNVKDKADPKKLLCGSSTAHQTMMQLVEKASRTDIPVLLSGEFGTGKTLVAQGIHLLGHRATHPFVVVDCVGSDAATLDTQIFGREKSQPGKAHSLRQGAMEIAAGGTLFFDEIAEMPMAIQSRLVRVLETGAWQRSGSLAVNRSSCRFMASTRYNLMEKVRTGQFRQDLYYLMGAFAIRVPPLRERTDDIETIARAMLAEMLPGEVKYLSGEAINALCAYDFPGNIRELSNFLKRACLAPGEKIDPADLMMREGQPTRWGTLADAHFTDALLVSHKGSRRELAGILGISERTLYRRLSGLRKKNGLEHDETP